MATTFQPETSRQLHPAGSNYELAPAVPQESEDFLLEDVAPLPLPKYDTRFESTTSIDTVLYEGVGTGYLEEWQMSDGIRFDVMFFEPDHLRTDVAVAEDTAWWTQVRGLNEDSGLESMGVGMRHVAKGPEKNGSIPLSHSAHNTNQVMAELEQTGAIEPGVFAIKGFSRGSMIGFGTAAYAAQDGRKSLYTNLTDPCLAEELKIELSREQLEKLGEAIAAAPAELLTVGLEIGRLLANPRRLMHYAKTVDLSRDGIRQVIDTGKPLFSGEAGFLAHHFPQDAEATVCFFLNSKQNQQDIFRAILASHTGVEFRAPRGGHVAGMNKRVLQHISRRFLGLVEQLEEGVAYDDIDYSLIHRPKPLT